ncbi:NACHT domain-containing protein [Serratia fonticola]|uniref:NACHT domain-containing protein n=1 Tax=Serratia fonticola TaxID=47917 RepID=UPI00186672ED|nr:NACHT domain-containing protein [Serratia fonticola]
MEPLSALIAGSFLTGVFETLGSKLAEAGINSTRLKANKIISSFKNKSIINKYLETAVYKVFVFRTITKGDRDVYLDEVYHPIKILLENRKNRSGVIMVDEGCFIDVNGHAAIVGLAGQGKTTIMRKLFLEELVRKQRVPFFITLRQYNYPDKVRCEDILLDHLISNGIDCEIDDVIGLLATGKVIFYWDGFDEIKFKDRNNALKMISSIYDKYSCSSIITTRPDTEITRQPGVELYKVVQLSNEDVHAMIKKIISNDEVSDSIINYLDKKRFLQDTIRTPILIDILIVTSSSLNDEPNSIRDYYEHLFSALMFRHDLNKNYTREKQSSLGNKDLEEIFSFFSFLSFMDAKSDFTHESMLGYFSKSCQLKKLKVSEENVCSDIINGTNLVTRDGYNNYIYIHRSIQEYFSAKCISLFTSERKDSFLKNYCRLENGKKSMNLLILLRSIDPIGFYKYYLIPYLEKYNIIIGEKLNILSKEDVSDFCDSWLAGAVKRVGGKSIRGVRGFAMYEARWGQNHPYFENISHVGELLDSYNSHIDAGDYFIETHSDVLIDFISSEKNADKLFEVSDPNMRFDDLCWVRIGNLKDSIPNYDEEFIEVYYDEYVKKMSDLQEIIDNEYFKKMESEIEVSNMLIGMGF